jgi:hypothetical protein
MVVADRLPVRPQGIGLLAAEDDTARGGLQRDGLRRALSRDPLEHSLGLIVLERRGVALYVVLMRTEPVDHLLVGEPQVLRELVDALLRHPSPSANSPFGPPRRACQKGLPL